ncbi:MAG: serine/threonine protein kinase [Bacteroidales bacterium]|nr:serine/threonine protein kinase [Bacteroidales bacterium]
MVTIKDIQGKEGLIDRHYRLLEKIGGGGFSEVWLAQDEKSGIQVALKVYMGAGFLNEEGKEMFRDEFVRVSKLTHGNIVRINHFDDEMHILFPSSSKEEKLAIPYLELPYYSKGSASKLIGNIDEETLWRFASQVASGLAYIHQLKKDGKPKPIIHSDIKPANVLIGDDGTFMITDFGISVDLRATIRPGKSINQDSGLTPEYADKDRHKGLKPVMATDIWALGASLFELATGDVPFGRMGGLTQESSSQKKPQIKQQLSSSLKELIWACLEENPWDRPSAQEVVEWARKRKRPVPRPSWTKKVTIAGVAIAVTGIAWWLWPKDIKDIVDPPIIPLPPKDSIMLAKTDEAKYIIKSQWEYSNMENMDSAIVCATKLADAGKQYYEAIAVDGLLKSTISEAAHRWENSQTIIDDAYKFFTSKEQNYRDIEADEPAEKYARCREIIKEYVSTEIINQ